MVARTRDSIEMTLMLNLKPSLATLTLAIGSLTATTPALAAVDPFDGGWHFTLTPYLWAPNINGSLDTRVTGLASRVAGLADNAELNLSTKIGPNDYLENLKFGIMLTGEVRKGNWSAFTDIIYIGQNLTTSDVTRISAGRDVTATSRVLPVPTATGRTNLPVLQGNSIVVGGPGALFVEAGRDLGRERQTGRGCRGSSLRQSLDRGPETRQGGPIRGRPGQPR